MNADISIFGYTNLERFGPQMSGWRISRIMKIAALLFIFIALLLLVGPALNQTESVDSPVVTVLSIISGGATYLREGMAAPEAILPGTLLHVEDEIILQDAVLQVQCPDNRVITFSGGELFTRDQVNCQIDPANYRLGSLSERRLLIARGGQQDPTIPYLIAPRATIVRTARTDLIWNPLLAVDHYRVTVRGGSAVIWESGELEPAGVVQGDVAQVDLPVNLQANIAYTVEICVLFEDLRSGCTTDPGWASGVNVAFFYRPTPELDQLEADIITELGSETPESLYARAQVFSQAIFYVADDVPIGVYHEAIALLEQLRTDYPDSPLAQSPELYNLLGELYRNVNLPRSAAQAFLHGLELAEPGTRSAAEAALGAALTIPGDPVDYYNQALDHYEMVLTPDAFAQHLANICTTSGDICLDLTRCQTDAALCDTASSQ